MRYILLSVWSPLIDKISVAEIYVAIHLLLLIDRNYIENIRQLRLSLFMIVVQHICMRYE